eukprot:756215-Hanusia_phi.AAC.6
MQSSKQPNPLQSQPCLAEKERMQFRNSAREGEEKNRSGRRRSGGGYGCPCCYTIHHCPGSPYPRLSSTPTLTPTPSVFNTQTMASVARQKNFKLGVLLPRTHPLTVATHNPLKNQSSSTMWNHPPTLCSVKDHHDLQYYYVPVIPPPMKDQQLYPPSQTVLEVYPLSLIVPPFFKLFAPLPLDFFTHPARIKPSGHKLLLPSRENIGGVYKRMFHRGRWSARLKEILEHNGEKTASIFNK